MATKTFKKKVLSKLNKDEKTLQEEKIDDKIKRFIIDANSQISLIKASTIPMAEHELSVAKRKLSEAEKSLADVYFNLGDEVSSYEDYVNRLNDAQSLVDEEKALVARIEARIEDSKAQLAKHEEVLKTLNS